MSNEIKIEMTDRINQVHKIKGNLINETETVNTNSNGSITTIKKVFKSNDGSNYAITLEKSTHKKK